MEGHCWALEPGMTTMLNTLGHKGYSVKMCLTQNANHVNTKMALPRALKMTKEYPIFHIILKILFWGNNTYGIQGATLKLVLFRLVCHPNIFLPQACFYDSQAMFYDSLYFTEPLENKYLLKSRRCSFWLVQKSLFSIGRLYFPT